MNKIMESSNMDLLNYQTFMYEHKKTACGDHVEFFYSPLPSFLLANEISLRECSKSLHFEGHF